MNRMRCGVWLLVTWCVCGALGQANISALKGKRDALSGADKTALAAWVRGQAQVVASDNTAAVVGALKSLRDVLRDASSAFEQELRPIASREIGQAVADASPSGACRLIALLGELGDGSAWPVLFEALQSENAGVRAAAAGSVVRLQPRLLAGGENVAGEVLQALEQAGQREQNPDVLMAFYRAMDFTGVPNALDNQQLIAAVLRVMAIRAQRAQQGELGAVGADGAGLNVLGKLRASSSPAVKQDLVRATAWLLRAAVERYVSDDALGSPRARQLQRVRDRLEYLMLQAEKALTESATGGAPAETFAAALKNGGSVEDVKAAMNAWAAQLQGQVEGTLAIE